LIAENNVAKSGKSIFYIIFIMNTIDMAKEPAPQARRKDPAGQAGRV
jgi:hypothetical protein